MILSITAMLSSSLPVVATEHTYTVPELDLNRRILLDTGHDPKILDGLSDADAESVVAEILDGMPDPEWEPAPQKA